MNRGRLESDHNGKKNLGEDSTTRFRNNQKSSPKIKKDKKVGGHFRELRELIEKHKKLKIRIDRTLKPDGYVYQTLMGLSTAPQLK